MNKNVEFLKIAFENITKILIKYQNPHHHRHFILTKRSSWTLPHNLSLSYNASVWSSMLYPITVQI